MGRNTRTGSIPVYGRTQNLEFSIREIAELDNLSKDEVRREVDAHILRLRQRKVEIDEYIDQAYELIEKIS